MKMLNIQVDVVCPNKRPKDKIATVVHDFETHTIKGYKGGVKIVDLQTYTEKRGHNLEINYDFNQVSAGQYDGFYIPGGRAPEYLRLNRKVIQICEDFFKRDLPVGAINRGPQILAAAKLLEGRKCTSWFGCSPEIKLAHGLSGEFKQVDVSEAITDGN